MARYEVLPRQELITHPKCTAHVTQPPWRLRPFECELHDSAQRSTKVRSGDGRIDIPSSAKWWAEA
jgi:hypothetical protein